MPDSVPQTFEDQARAMHQVRCRFPTIAVWCAGGRVLVPDLIKEMKAALRHLGTR